MENKEKIKLLKSLAKIIKSCSIRPLDEQSSNIRQLRQLANNKAQDIINSIKL